MRKDRRPEPRAVPVFCLSLTLYLRTTRFAANAISIVPLERRCGGARFPLIWQLPGEPQSTTARGSSFRYLSFRPYRVRCGLPCRRGAHGRCDYLCRV